MFLHEAEYVLRWKGAKPLNSLSKFFVFYAPTRINTFSLKGTHSAVIGVHSEGGTPCRTWRCPVEGEYCSFTVYTVLVNIHMNECVCHVLCYSNSGHFHQTPPRLHLRFMIMFQKGFTFAQIHSFWSLFQYLLYILYCSMSIIGCVRVVYICQAAYWPITVKESCLVCFLTLQRSYTAG